MSGYKITILAALLAVVTLLSNACVTNPSSPDSEKGFGGNAGSGRGGAAGGGHGGASGGGGGGK